MSLPSGLRVGSYEIVALLGEGGMGQVYRAVDTRLDRQVAIKVLPEAVRADPERTARFEREAKLLASLNHQNIAAIHGLERVDAEQFIVMELVEGETLAEVIARQGGTPRGLEVKDALQIAKQIADALEAAHEAGVIHRDLKPANVKVRPDGTVKVLDFGLAKALGGDSLSSPASLTNSPTITSPVAVTGVGMLLGTAAYMSPEQAKGKAADKRSDLWAFGCVFYEMLSGRRAFDGEDVSDTLAAVLRGEPDWAALPPGTPPAIQRLLRRCLEKDRHRRVGDIAAALVLIEEASAPKGEAARVDPAVRSRDRLRPALLAIATLILGGVVAGTGAWLMMRRPTLTPPIRRFTLTFPQPATFTPTPLGRDIAISPDGTAVVYVTTNARQLFLRRLDRLDVTPLAIDGGRTPFFSPDGRWVGYFVLDGLYKVSIDGGLPTRLTGSVGAPRGATWTPDNTIVFATSDPGMGLLQVSADGGEPKALTTPDPSVNELDHLWPQILPGRAAVLFTIQPRGPLEGAQVSVLDLGTGQRKVVLAGTDARYVSPGWLVYGAAGKLQAVRFSVTDLAVSGAPVPVLDQVLTTPDGGMNLTTSGDGTLVYAAGTGRGDPRRLVWVDRQGRETPLDIEPQPFNGPRLSRDGKRLAAWVDDPSNADVVVLDQRQTLRRLTFDRARDSRSMWTPDDKWILFRSDHETDGPGIYRKASDGIGAAERIVPVIGDGGPHSVTRDGLTLIYTSTGTSTLRDIWMVSLDGDRTPRPLIVEPANQNNPTISPDGRWIAYDEEGYVIVRPFPKVAAGRWQVASSGSRWPVWSWNGRELFYVVGRALMSIPVESTAETFQWTAGSKVFEGSYSGLQGLPFLPRNYDVSPDGQRFLMIKESETGASATVIIVENWREELKRLVPTN